MLKRYATNWCARSEEKKESFEKWVEEKRGWHETDSLVTLTFETYQGIRDGHKA